MQPQQPQTPAHLEPAGQRSHLKRILLVMAILPLVGCILLTGYIFYPISYLLWRHDVGGVIASAPLIADGVAYFGTLGGEFRGPAFYAVDIATGRERWQVPVNADIFFWAPALVNGTVFFSTDDGYFIALEAETGREQWRFTPEQRNLPANSDCLSCAARFRPPATAHGIIYVSSHDGYLYALDAQTGAEKWRFAAGDNILGTVAIADSLLYAGSMDGNVYVLDALTGVEQKRFNTHRNVFSLNLDGDMLYVANHELVALDRHTGAEQWRYRPDLLDLGGFTERPFTHDNLVYIMTHDNLYAVDKKTGQPAWQFNDINGNVFSEATLADSLIYFGDSNSYLYAIDAQTGTLRRRTNMAVLGPGSYLTYTAEFVFSPTVVDGVVYVGWFDHLYTLQAPDP